MRSMKTCSTPSACILQRQREGIAIAKENGVYKGRKPIVCAGFDSVLMLWCRREITAVEAQKRLGLSPSTFYRKVSEYAKANRKGGRNMIWYVLGFLLTAALLLIVRHGLCCKMITWAAVAKAIAAFSKGVLLALELLGYDSSN